MIKELSKFDLPSGYRNAGFNNNPEPLLTQENMSAIWNKLNELIDAFNRHIEQRHHS